MTPTASSARSSTEYFYLARHVADGAAGVPVVIPDHVLAEVGELAAEVLGPPHCRSHRAHDEENGRAGRIPEGLRIEVDSVRRNPFDFHSVKKSDLPYK